MQQSPDDIFAAHFWSWPDPALKRDGQGRVLFVNAAFLQLFGGRVEDWRGQSVGGWHTPQPNGGPTRFELRTPATPTLGEQVYDWVELPGADGSAFALARNVTPFMAQSLPTPPGAQAHPGDTQADTDATYAARQAHDPIDAAPAYEPVQHAADGVSPLSDLPSTQTLLENAAQMRASEVEAAEAAPAAPAAAEAAPEIAAPAAVPPAPIAAAPAAPAPDVVMDVPAIDVPDISVPPIEAAPRTPTPAFEATAEPAAEAPTTDAPVVQTAAEPAPAAQAPARDFERRALPIENDEAVLGNNWRDAVIAKAVGAVEPKVEAEPEAPEPVEETKDTIRILLAEDNAINALLTRTLLEADGHTVETVEDGVQAVEAMKTSSFDLIFMDMRMPNMDGLEATRKIRALVRVPADLPIIALTANAFDDDRNACFDSGMNDFMTKPVSAEELSEMVQRWALNPPQALAS